MEFKIYNYLHDDSKKIRQIVFVEEQEFVDEFDELDKISKHIVLYDNNLPIANCRIYTLDNVVYHIGRVAIIKEYRGRNIGIKLMNKAEEIINNLNGKRIELSAQARVKDFYKKCGYEEFGDIFYEEYCPHINMKKYLEM